MAINLAGEQKKAQEKVAASGIRVMICTGTGCVANGADEVVEKFEELGVKTSALGIKDKLSAVPTGCHGFCEQGVLVVIPSLDVTYVRVKAADVQEIYDHHIKGGIPVERLLYVDPQNQNRVQKNEDFVFYARQTRTSLAYCGRINPEILDEAVAIGAYQSLAKVLAEGSPEAVIETVEKSGLRGRGGGGFPTGRKWRFTAANRGGKSYVVCNGDEGDPGAFMDRSLMEGDPHRLLEGMAIGGYAIGADEAYIYVRAEYPLAIKRLRIAIDQAEKAGYLGTNILGTNFNFIIHIKEGAGAFVCGEETALIASIEGERGMPRPKPPFPANSGLFGRPTLINNVETLANIPMIIEKGASWFASMGTATSKGTKTFALTGEVNNTGLIEVPMGTTLREIIFDIGGGIRGGKKFKAVQIGGPSGGCLTEEHLDLPMDYETLIQAGAMVGSGGLVVLAEDTCMIEVARFFMNFTKNESCGKCTPCREGTKQMLAILERIVKGRGCEDDLLLLEELALAVKDGSLCGLGKTAPNPILSTLKYFKDEYLEHIRDHKCRAGVCAAMKKVLIRAEICIGCTKCSRVCPTQAIDGAVKVVHVIDQEKCIKCEACLGTCPTKAIFVE